MKTVTEIAKEAAESVFSTIEDGAVSLESASKAIERVMQHHGMRPHIAHEPSANPRPTATKGAQAIPAAGV
jgi:hypothetical protein